MQRPASVARVPFEDRAVFVDFTRIVATALVALHHALSVCGVASPKILGGLDIGELGVVAFFAMSGFFAVQGRSSCWRQWLVRRLVRIYVPYWWALTAVLVANYVIGYKPMNLTLLLFQYLAIAGWTHPDQLVGVHFWFISVIVLCYMLAVMVRQHRLSLAVLVFISALAVHFRLQYASQIMVFLAGCCAGLCVSTVFAPLVICLIVLAVAMGLAERRSYLQVAVGLAAILPAKASNPFSATAAKHIAAVSDNCYYFYLVHGPIFLGVARWVGPWLLPVLTVGTVCSVVGSRGLHSLDVSTRRWFSSRAAWAKSFSA